MAVTTAACSGVPSAAVTVPVRSRSGIVVVVVEVVVTGGNVVSGGEAVVVGVGVAVVGAPVGAVVVPVPEPATEQPARVRPRATGARMAGSRPMEPGYRRLPVVPGMPATARDGVGAPSAGGGER